MKWSELLLLLALTIFSGMLLKDSFALSYSSEGGFGPGFIPRNFAIVTILLAMLLGGQSYLAGRKQQIERDDQKETGEYSILAPSAAVVLLFTATFTMHFGSVLAPLAVVTTVISAVFLGHSWVKAAGLTLATLAVIYAIFSVWLKIPVI